MLKRIVRNFAALFSGEIIARICHFVAVIYLARVFGTAGFGAINFSLAIVSYFLLATNLGLAQLGIREVARKKDMRDIVETILSIRVLIAIISFLVIVVITKFIHKSQSTKDLILLYSISLFPYALSLDWVFKGIERMKYNAYGRVINAAIYVIAIFMIIRNPADILKAAIISVGADLITSAFYFSHYVKKFGPIRLHFDLKRWSALVSISSQLFFASALVIIYLNFGTVALGFMKDDAAVGIYGAAYKIIYICYAVSDVFVAVIYPVASRFHHESRQLLQDFINRCFKVLFLLGLPVIVGGSILGSRMINLVYGASYSDAGPLFAIMSWFSGINIVGYMLSYTLVACDRQNVYLKILMYGTLLNIAFNLCAIPFIGYYAPSVALVMTEAVIFISSIAALKKVITLKIGTVCLKPIVAAAVMAVVLLVFGRLNTIILFCMAPICYFGVLIAIGGIRGSEIARIREAVALT